jgi:C4-dicarboxylate-specific signal transduction histidine kinase
MRRHVARSPLSRYGAAILCVTATVGFALWLGPAVMAAGQLSLVAIVITGWVCGLRPALLGLFMAAMSAGRRSAEDSLETASEELEARVRERTADLERSVSGHRINDAAST